jgi:hypothetical protein
MGSQDFRESYSPQSDDLFNTDHSVFELGNGLGPRIQLVKPSYPAIPDETLYELGILQPGQTLNHPGQALNLQYLGHQQYMLPQNKEESLELEDYVQGLNDRFELPNDQIPMTPRCSFDQGCTSL